MTNRSNLTATAPQGGRGYITAKKQYPIIGEPIEFDGDTGRLFRIKVDTGEVVYCIEKNCPHLMGKNWEISHD
jgi:hypothetical protein